MKIKKQNPEFYFIASWLIHPNQMPAHFFKCLFDLFCLLMLGVLYVYIERDIKKENKRDYHSSPPVTSSNPFQHFMPST